MAEGFDKPVLSDDALAVVGAPVVLPDGSRLENRLVAFSGDCCGCTACMAVCPTGSISMVEDAEGFKYPTIDEGTCVGCGRCERACGFKRALAEPECVGPTCEPLVFAAKHTSDDVRRESSSGGVFWALAEHVIGSGGVVFGCAFDEELVAGHIRAETFGECARCRGSKYSQSDMGACLSMARDDLAAGRRVLFTGTPCQVHALRMLLEVSRDVSFGAPHESDGPDALDVSGESDAPAVESGRLICVDNVCHGVPSPLMFREHLAFLGQVEGSPVTAYWHRPKDTGWKHAEKVGFADGTFKHRTPLANSWRELFYDNRILRPSCYHCPFTQVRRTGDVTAADFWGIARTPLVSFSDDLGVSLLLVNTEVGGNLVDGLSLVRREATLGDALPANPMLYRPSSYCGRRQEVWELYREKGYARMMRELHFHQSIPRFAGVKFKRLAMSALRRLR